jgi:hypothetical protein
VPVEVLEVLARLPLVVSANGCFENRDYYDDKTKW